ncbi:MAG: 3',5'-cyclic-nucleotide phosphodiesterase [Acidobacteriota bacterium]
MEWHVLGSFGGSSPDCRMTSFLINGELALDAGSLTQALSIEEQYAIRRIVITHSHLDHVASIPFLIENTFGAQRDAIEILLTPQVLTTVKRHLFNNDTWPDFTRIPNDMLPALRLVEVAARTPFDVNGLRLTAIPVRHTVPTHGYLVEDGTSAVLFTSDTGPTEEVWRVANSTPNLTAVIVELSFPNRMQQVADVSLHLTPATLAAELAKLHRDVAVYLYHFKPPYVDELRREIAATQVPHPVQELQQGKVYQF